MRVPPPAGLPAALLAVLLAGCAAPAPGRGAPPAPVPSPAVPSPELPAPPAPASSAGPAAWVVGARPLPLRADGFGAVLPTPRVLRDRRLPTTDLLPPPRGAAFASTVGPVTPMLLRRMGRTYRPGCPVPPPRLRYVTVGFRGFDGRPHTGELVVAERAAAPVVAAFAELYALGFPIEQMRLPTTADVQAPPTGDGNDTAAFVCRTARGQRRLSAHAYGLAVDVNPFHNPLVRDDLVLPELAGAYADRRWVRPGMLLPGSAAVRAFTRRGFTWGGDFRRPKDYQHFSLTGR